jgi:hypothetical protein
MMDKPPEDVIENDEKLSQWLREKQLDEKKQRMKNLAHSQKGHDTKREKFI